jgi:hypothetical protein
MGEALVRFVDLAHLIKGSGISAVKGWAKNTTSEAAAVSVELRFAFGANGSSSLSEDHSLLLASSPAAASCETGDGQDSV